MEEHASQYNDKLTEFTTLSQQLEKAVGSTESQRLLEAASHFQNSLSGIRQGKELNV